MIAVAALFWPRVEKTESCWLWTASRNAMGYGQFRVGSKTDRSSRCALAHRVAWELVNGAVPAGLCVLHRCDNPRCVNPAHLFLGTRTDNSRDKVAKGRQRSGRLPGERNPAAKLTAESVAAVRARASRGESGVALAREFGVSPTTVSRVIRGVRWA